MNMNKNTNYRLPCTRMQVGTKLFSEQQQYNNIKLSLANRLKTKPEITFRT